MTVSIDSRIWLAAHLLYPNTSQAFDVYHTLLTQSEESIRRNNINTIFQKLHQIAEKIPAVSSNKAFHVFEEEQTEQWQQIYKKSQKEQIIIFVGYFIFSITLKDMSGILKLSFEKVQFLFHQTFKKAILSHIKMDVPEKIPFRKQNEIKVMFLFTTENLIDYCLQNLSPKDMEKVELGLQQYPELQLTEKQYQRIVKQMNYFVRYQEDRVAKPLIQSTETLSAPREVFHFGIWIRSNKTLITSGVATVFCLVLVTIRPQWLQNLNHVRHNRLVDLQEIKPMQTPTELENLPATPVLAANETKPILKNQLQVADSSVKREIVGSKATTETKPESKLPSHATTPAKAQGVVEKPHEVLSESQPKKSGGLYRGVLTVTDINEVSDKITQKLVDIGGKKAGEVELGWRKTDKLAYYHFTLPEDSVDGMKEFLSKFGSLQIQFENHPRLMPAGVKRLIIEVKERE